MQCSSVSEMPNLEDLERAECCDAWTEITEGDLSQQLHFMRWPGICRPEPLYDTYVSLSDSDDGFDDFPDVDGWVRLRHLVT
jgi:hypothetical protein